MMESSQELDPADGCHEDPNTDPCDGEAMSYLREHKILELFEQLTASLVYQRPENPREFMKAHIRQLQTAKQSPEEDPPFFIDQSNIESVFGMLDITNRGHISLEQYLAAMKSMGVGQFNSSPAGAELNKIGRETFIRESKAALKAAASTFLDY